MLISHMINPQLNFTKIRPIIQPYKEFPQKFISTPQACYLKFHMGSILGLMLFMRIQLL